MKFNYTVKNIDRTKIFEDNVEILKIYRDHFELYIENAGIHLLIGKTTRGNFACLPDLKIGCHLVPIVNKYWNYEMLLKTLGTENGLAVYSAITKLSENFTIL